MCDVMIIKENWQGADKYDAITQRYVSKQDIWHYKQNKPDLVVEDIIEMFPECDADDLRSKLHAILIKRGVAKWLMVRLMLIRLKKLYVIYINALSAKVRDCKNNEDWKNYHYYRGQRAAFNTVRDDLKTMCMSPRYVVWSSHGPGLIDTIGLPPKYERKWLALYKHLRDVRF